MPRSATRPVPGMLAARAAALAALLAAGTAGVAPLAAGPALELVAAVRGGGPVRLEEYVAGLCGLALACCWAWGLLAATAVALAAVRSTAAGGTATGGSAAGSGHRRLSTPRLVRVLVLAVLGLAPLAAPASAGPPAPRCEGPAAGPGALSGLPLPDRVPGSAAPLPSRVAPRVTLSHRPDRLIVRSGDSLWLLAAGLLPDGAAPARVDRTWRALAAANPAAVGDDPDLIFPGTVLLVPGLQPVEGEEAS